MTRNAFDHCPNKTLRAIPGQETDPEDFKDLEVVCAQFPFGSRDIVSENALHIGWPGPSQTFARRLGCATCWSNTKPLERADVQRVAPDGTLEIETRFVPHTDLTVI